MTNRRSLLSSAAVLALTAGLCAGTTTPASSAPARTTTTSTTVAAAPPATKPKGGGKGGKGKVVWDSTTFTAGAGLVAAHGKVPGGKRKLVLQVRVKGGWQSFAKTKTKRNGKFAISAPLDWYGVHSVRIATKGNKNRFTKKTKVSVGTAYAPRGNPAAYQFLWDGGQDVKTAWRFNPCKTLTYRVNFNEVGPGALVLAQLAMAQVSAATGIKVQYLGPTDVIPHSNYTDPLPNPSDTGLVIAWGSLAEVPEFQRQNKAGFGGPHEAVYARNAKGKKVVETKQASLTIATEYYQSMFDPSFDSATRATMGEVLLHEIGHALGLAHVTESPEEIMNGVTYQPYPDGHRRGLYALGDLAGLAKLGLGEGCLTKLKRGRHRETTFSPVAPDLS